MPSKILKFRSPAVSDNIRIAQEARDHCVQQHQLRMTLEGISRIVDFARASIEEQSLTKLQTLQRTAKLLIVTSARPIKKTIQPVASATRAVFIARGLMFLTLAAFGL